MSSFITFVLCGAMQFTQLHIYKTSQLAAILTQMKYDRLLAVKTIWVINLITASDMQVHCWENERGRSITGWMRTKDSCHLRDLPQAMSIKAGSLSRQIPNHSSSSRLRRAPFLSYLLPALSPTRCVLQQSSLSWLAPVV